MTETELKTRPSMIARLRNRDDRETWREFFDRYGKLVYGLAIKSGLSEDEAKEAVQETMATLSKNFDGYEYQPRDCSFKSWIFNAAKWKIIDQIRRRRPVFLQSNRPNSDPDRTATVERAPDESASWERIWDEEWRQNLLQTAIDRVRGVAAIKDFQVFDLHVLKGRPVGEVKQMLRVSAAYVYVAKHRVSTLIKKEIRQMEDELD